MNRLLPLLLILLATGTHAASREKPRKYADHEVGCLYEGLATYTQKGRFGYVDKNGKIVIPIQYDSAESFAHGRAIVSKRGSYGIINKRGKAVVPLRYGAIDPYSDALARVMRSWEPIIFVDYSGKKILRTGRMCASDFSEGLAIWDCGGGGYINKKGEHVIKNLHKHRDLFYEGRALVQDQNNKYF